MESAIRALFQRHEDNFNRAIAGNGRPEDAAALFAPEFIAASQAGVMTGKNDEDLLKVIEAGYDHYRQTGARRMTVRDIAVTPIDENHALARVSWHARYHRKDGVETDVDFDVSYFVQNLGDEPKIFGWVAGDEEALLRERGLG